MEAWRGKSDSRCHPSALRPSWYHRSHLRSLLYISPGRSPSGHGKSVTACPLCCNADNTACWTRASIASLLGLLRATATEIVRASVHDYRTAQHTLGTDQLDLVILDATNRVALRVSANVTQVTDVTLLVARGPMTFAKRVEVRAS